jgi:hypothetical protein
MSVTERAALRAVQVAPPSRVTNSSGPNANPVRVSRKVRPETRRTSVDGAATVVRTVHVRPLSALVVNWPALVSARPCVTSPNHIAVSSSGLTSAPTVSGGVDVESVVVVDSGAVTVVALLGTAVVVGAVLRWVDDVHPADTEASTTHAAAARDDHLAPNTM